MRNDESVSSRARQLLSVADHLVRRSVWIVGGDGWAYDIGSGGVDHVLASGRNVNLLVLNMQHGLDQQSRAVHSGYWPLIRYNPTVRESGENPFSLDSVRPTLRLREYTDQELRYRLLARTNPEAAEQLMQAAERAVARRWKLYEGLAALP